MYLSVNTILNLVRSVLVVFSVQKRILLCCIIPYLGLQTVRFRLSPAVPTVDFLRLYMSHRSKTPKKIYSDRFLFEYASSDILDLFLVEKTSKFPRNSLPLNRLPRNKDLAIKMSSGTNSFSTDLLPKCLSSPLRPKVLHDIV